LFKKTFPKKNRRYVFYKSKNERVVREVKSADARSRSVSPQNTLIHSVVSRLCFENLPPPRVSIVSTEHVVQRTASGAQTGEQRTADIRNVFDYEQTPIVFRLVSKPKTNLGGKQSPTTAREPTDKRTRE